MRIFALIIALAVPSWGQQQPVVGSYRDFSGGLNNDDASVSIAANESPNLLNVQIDEPKGALTQRKGYQTCGTIPSGNIVTNLYEYAKNDGTRRLIVTDNETVWQTANCIDFSTVTTGLNSLELPRFATVLDNLWVVNGSTWAIVWDGTTATQLDGLDDRPEAPIGKYISYWKSRVWIANDPTSPSSVYFSALVDDAGDLLNPATSTGAWLSTNQIYINRDDGSPIYGMKPYRDNLYIWKETGINRIIFESEFNLSLTKNVSNTGSKFNESIVEMDDGLIRFLGTDGIYAFDGSRVRRLSSNITPTIDTIKQQTGGQRFQLWDTGQSFNEGMVVSVSTNDIPGGVSLYRSTLTVADFSSPSLSDWTTAGSWTVSGGRLVRTAGTVWISYNNIGVDRTLQDYFYFSVEMKRVGSESMCSFLFPSNSAVDGTNTGERVRVCSRATQYDLDVGGVQLDIPATPSTDNHVFELILHSTYTYLIIDSNIALSTQGAAATFSTIQSITNTDGGGVGASFDNFIINPGSSSYKSDGTFTSQISTFTGLSQWRTFAVDETLNGQTIDYYVRTGTTAYNVTLADWSSISSGLIISTTTDEYAQWKADFTTTDNSVTPLINSVSMGYATGDTSATAVKGIQYKSRLWLAASTGTTNNFNDMVIVESKSPLNTYTLYDLPLSAMAIWSGNLYGAIGNTGKIARLDYGDTDDGAAISSFWDSRDEVFDNPIFYKTVNQVILDYSNSPANTSVSVGLSPDQGSTYQTRSVNLGASSLPRNTAKLNYTPETALGFRTRLSNSTLGHGFKIYGIHPFGTIIPYLGN